MLYNAALQHMDASEAGVYTNLIPIVGVSTGLVLGEPLSQRAIIGGFVVFAGVWLTGLQRGKSGQERPAQSRWPLSAGSAVTADATFFPPRTSRATFMSSISLSGTWK